MTEVRTHGKRPIVSRLATLVLAFATAGALAVAEPAAAARRRPIPCTLEGGGFIWLLAYTFPPNVQEVLNTIQGLPTSQPGATQLLDLAPFGGEAALRFDCDPRLGGSELRLRNTTGSAIQGALGLRTWRSHVRVVPGAPDSLFDPDA